MPIENILLGVAILILASVVSSMLSDRFSVPVLLLFLAVGMLAGSEGVGGIHFDNAGLAKTIGIVALVFIIFAGGLDTRWPEVRPVALPGLLLSTVGVVLTALITAGCAMLVLRFSLLEGLLFGSIISSTDAAAVFGVLRSRRINLKPPLRPLLEFESASNDPMAMFLTAGFLGVITAEGRGVVALLPRLALDMAVGAGVGLAMGRLVVALLRRLRLAYEGLYPVAMVGFALLIYTLAVLLRGNGILAVYLAGLVLGQSQFPNKPVILKFQDSVAWLMQIVMFVTLGLLVFPSRVVPLAGPGLLLAFLLMFVARPASVLLCLAPFRMSARHKVFISWVGLRGAVPVILATFPLMAGVRQADTIFNIVFFVVVASVLLQGMSVPLLARLLKLNAPAVSATNWPIEFRKAGALDVETADVIVPYDAAAAGRTIAELGLPDKCRILLIARGGSFVMPTGSTVIQGGDVLQVLADDAGRAALSRVLTELRDVPADEPAGGRSSPDGTRPD